MSLPLNWWFYFFSVNSACCHSFVKVPSSLPTYCLCQHDQSNSTPRTVSHCLCPRAALSMIRDKVTHSSMSLCLSCLFHSGNVPHCWSQNCCLPHCQCQCWSFQHCRYLQSQHHCAQHGCQHCQATWWIGLYPTGDRTHHSTARIAPLYQDSMTGAEANTPW